MNFFFYLFLLLIFNKKKNIIYLANAKARHHHYISVLGARKVEAQQIHSNRHSYAVLSQVLVVAMKRMIAM